MVLGERALRGRVDVSDRSTRLVGTSKNRKKSLLATALIVATPLFTACSSSRESPSHLPVASASAPSYPSSVFSSASHTPSATESRPSTPKPTSTETQTLKSELGGIPSTINTPEGKVAFIKTTPEQLRKLTSQQLADLANSTPLKNLD